MGFYHLACTHFDYRVAAYPSGLWVSRGEDCRGRIVFCTLFSLDSQQGIARPTMQNSVIKFCLLLVHLQDGQDLDAIQLLYEKIIEFVLESSLADVGNNITATSAQS